MLSVRSDSAHIQQRVFSFLASSAGTPGLVSAAVVPNIGGSSSGTLGQRVLQISQGFSRYRIHRAVAVLTPSVSTPGGNFFFGFADDSAAFFAPTSPQAILDLRCSRAVSTSGSEANYELEWRPVDKKKWYYTDASSTTVSADLRFAAPCTIFLYDSTAAVSRIDLYLDMSFEGSGNVNTTQ
jgi:hypothetical protein